MPGLDLLFLKFNLKQKKNEENAEEKNNALIKLNFFSYFIKWSGNNHEMNGIAAKLKENGIRYNENEKKMFQLIL